MPEVGWAGSQVFPSLPSDLSTKLIKDMNKQHSKENMSGKNMYEKHIMKGMWIKTRRHHFSFNKLAKIQNYNVFNVRLWGNGHLSTKLNDAWTFTSRDLFLCLKLCILLNMKKRSKMLCFKLVIFTSWRMNTWAPFLRLGFHKGKGKSKMAYECECVCVQKFRRQQRMAFHLSPWRGQVQDVRVTWRKVPRKILLNSFSFFTVGILVWGLLGIFFLLPFKNELKERHCFLEVVARSWRWILRPSLLTFLPYTRSANGRLCQAKW